MRHGGSSPWRNNGSRCGGAATLSNAKREQEWENRAELRGRHGEEVLVSRARVLVRVPFLHAKRSRLARAVILIVP